VRHGKEVTIAFESPVAGGSDAACVSWRHGHRELPVGGDNTINKLMRREIDRLNDRTPPRPDVAFCAEKFRCFKL
jgi:hypothetical protein